jgi:hypothetical protein
MLFFVIGSGAALYYYLWSGAAKQSSSDTGDPDSPRHWSRVIVSPRNDIHTNMEVLDLDTLRHRSVKLDSEEDASALSRLSRVFSRRVAPTNMAPTPPPEVY